MKRTRAELRQAAIPLATALVLGATLAMALPAGAEEPQYAVILIADVNQNALDPSGLQEKHSEVIQPAARDVQAPAPAVEAAPPLWVPRIRHGAPASRIGGATRSQNKVVRIQTLVPEVDEAALTLAAQPTLYWHLSEKTTHPVNFTLIDPDAIDPIVDAMIEGPFEAGVQRLSLADYDARLETGRNYEWFVAVVPDTENRSADSVARGAIARIADADLASQISASEPTVAASLLARSGIWYEAFDAVSRGVRETPEDSQMRKRRDAMLAQVGLTLHDER